MRQAPRHSSARSLFFTIASALALGACTFGGGDPMADAQAAFADNDYRAARIHLMTALKDNSSDPQANFLYGKTLLRLGDGVAAEAAFKKLSGKDQYAGEIPALTAHAMLLRGLPEKALDLVGQTGGNSSLAYWVKARALMELDRKEEAVTAISEGLSNLPDDPTLLALRGNYEISIRNISAARRTAALALKQAPNDLDVLMLSGQLAVMRQDLAAAKTIYDKALKLYPDSIVPLFSVAAVSADLGDEKAAKAHLKRVLELAPSHPMALFLMAKIAFNDGDIDKAFTLMQKADSALEDVPGAMLLQGEIAYLQGNYEQSIDRLRRFLIIIPGHIQGTTVLGSALAAVGNDTEAYQIVKPAAQRAAATPQLLALAARLAQSQNDPLASRFDLRAKKPRDRNDIAIKLTEADKAINQKKWVKAEAIYADLRASGLEGNAIIMNNSALVQLELGNGAKAAEFARAAMRLTPGDPHVMDSLGWILLQSGQDRVEALSLLRQASAKAPANLEIRWHLANALAANGEKADAKRIVNGLKAFATVDQQQQIEKLLARL